MKSITLAALLADSKNRLAQADIPNASQDARLLVEWTTGTTRKDMIMAPDQTVCAAAEKKLQEALHRRLKGEPVYRIIGEREFYGLPFILSAETLEPRDDTEALVGLVLQPMRDKAQSNSGISFIDLGTGTGAIAITILTQIETAQGLGVDISVGALKTAQINAENAKVANRFNICHSNGFKNIKGRFDFILSNPPYIPSHEIETLEREVKAFDPIQALDGGPDGLDFYRLIASNASEFLHPYGMVGVEIGKGQERDVEALFLKHGFKQIGYKKDLSDIIRALLFQLI